MYLTKRNVCVVVGSPFTATIFTDPDRIVVSGQSLASSAVGKTSYFKMSNVTGSVEDIEINVEGLTNTFSVAPTLSLILLSLSHSLSFILYDLFYDEFIMIVFFNVSI